MSRVITYRFRDPDTTAKMNDMYRRIVKPGVYSGYAVSSGGSGGLWLKFSHATDPDNAARKLGIVYTRDGAVVREDSDQDDVVVGSLSAGLPNVHYVVASYTYNASFPPNDVVYAVRQGTSGPVPTPPVLGEDEVLLASIYVPAGAVAYTSPGVSISSVAKLDLYGDSLSVTERLAGVLSPGIYRGIETVRGTSDLAVTLQAGAWISRENALVVEAADQTDLLTLANPGVGQYAYAWVIGAHKADDTDPPPTADYLLVQGTPVALAATASLPSYATIQTAVEAISPKYVVGVVPPDGHPHISKLGYIRVENRAGTYAVKYIRGETHLQQDTLRVFCGTDEAGHRSGRYYGAEGLSLAVQAAYDLLKAREDGCSPLTITIDGELQLPGVLYVPSNVILSGSGYPAAIRGEAGYPVSLAGTAIEWNGAAATVTTAAGVSTPAGGYVARRLSIQAPYQTGATLEDRRLSYGDIVYLWSEAQAKTYIGYVHSVVSPWVVEIHIETQYSVDGFPVDLDILVKKWGNGLKDISVSGLVAATPAGVDVSYTSTPVIDGLRCDSYLSTQTSYAKIGSLQVDTSLSFGAGVLAAFPSTTPNLWSDGNLYGSLTVAATGQTLFTGERSASIGTLDLKSTGTVVAGTNTNIGALLGPATLQGTDVRVGFAAQTPTIATADRKTNKVGYLGSTATSRDSVETEEHGNQDRNLKAVSDASISWNAGTGLLSWDDHVYFDLPFTTGRNRIPLTSSPVMLGVDGDRLCATLSRSATGTTDITIGLGSLYVRPKASAASDARDPHIMLVAVRHGTTVYLCDGTRIEDGQVVTLGSTPPPDGSVTFEKLAPSAVEFHNQYYQAYAVPQPPLRQDDDVVWRNTSLSAAVYGPTGTVTYSTPVDLSVPKALFDAGVPLALQTIVGTHEIVGVDSTTRVYLDGGLGLVIGAASLWNASIVRGSKVITNDGLVSTSYNKTTGRISWLSGLSFPSTIVIAGHVFVDNDGKKYRIIQVDPSGAGSWVDIVPGVTDISVGVPADKHGGSIERDNNPLELRVRDLRTLAGVEFIPLDYAGDMDTDSPHGASRVREALRSLSTVATSAHAYTIAPHDPRVRVFKASDAGLTTLGPSGSLNRGDFVLFTGVCTSAYLVTAGGGVASQVTIDMISEFVGPTDKADAVAVSGEYGHTQFVPHLPVSPTGGVHSRPHPQGVHTFCWQIKEQVRGIVVVNSPTLDPGTGVRVYDSPGTLVRNGGVETYLNPAVSAAMPANPSSPLAGFDKGGRAIRYIDTAGVRQWAHRWVRTFLSTGDTTIGLTTITNVSSPTSWTVGDIIVLVDLGAGGEMLLRKITNITGTTITVDSAIGFTAAGVDLHYYGRTAGATGSSSASRGSEEVAVTVPVTEFATPGWISDSYGASGLSGVARTSKKVSIRLPDGTTGLMTREVAKNTATGGLILDANSMKLRFTFVGTGLSIGCTMTGSSLSVLVDGWALSTLTTTSAVDAGGMYVVGELPYGQHVVEIVTPPAGAVDCTLFSFTIWQPASPALPDGAYETFDTNLVGAKLGAIGIAITSTLVAGTDAMEFGTVNKLVAPSLSMDPAGASTAAVLAYTASTTGLQTSAIAHVADQSYYFSFYGDSFTLLYLSDAQCSIHVLDTDMTWRAPSAMLGFSVYGTDVLPIHAACTRHSWGFSKVRHHHVRVTAPPAVTVLEMDSYDVRIPFHTHKEKVPVAMDHFLPCHETGRDARSLTPIPPLSPGRGVELVAVQGREVVDGVPVDTEVEQPPYIFYSHGGLVELNWSASVTSTDVAERMNLYVDGKDVVSSRQMLGVVVAGPGAVSASGTATLSLPRGLHFAYLAPTIGSVDAYWIQWQSRAYAPGTASRAVPHPSISLR